MRCSLIWGCLAVLLGVSAPASAQVFFLKVTPAEKGKVRAG